MAIKKRYSKTKGTRYLAVVDLRGKQINKVFSRKIDAEPWEFAQREKQLKPHGVASSPLQNASVAKFLDHCFLHSKRSGKAATTLCREEGTIRMHIVPHLGAIKLSELSPKICEDWFHGLAQRGGLEPSSANRCRVVFSKFLSDAVRWQLIPSNPLIYVKPLKTRKGFKDFLTQSEMVQLLEYVAYARPELSLCLTLLALTGCEKARHGD
jgi:hypothetical protein